MHIALCYARETIDRRTVKPDTVFERCGQLVYRDGNVFDHTHHVSELQIDELNMILFGVCENIGS